MFIVIFTYAKEAACLFGIGLGAEKPLLTFGKCPGKGTGTFNFSANNTQKNPVYLIRNPNKKKSRCGTFKDIHSRCSFISAVIR